MTQAARSGRANNAEGSARRETSRETEMRLTDVSRASLTELMGDYLQWLMAQEQVPWPKSGAEAQEIANVRLDPPQYGSDLMHDACCHILVQKKKFDRWLKSDSDIEVANALLIMLGRAINMLNHQMQAQLAAFTEEGGFREALHDIRVEARAVKSGAPLCPDCGRPMARRKAKSGPWAGSEFWGCSIYPKCSGVRNIEPEEQQGEQAKG